MFKFCRPIFFAFVLIVLFNSVFSQTFSWNGMVVSDHVIASEVGVDIMKKGGNAIDASIATAFALAVTHPQAGNIGGGGFLVYYDSAGNATTIDFREKAPLAATADMFMDDEGNLVPGSNHKGLKSVGVPGTVAGLWMAHQKYGKLPWRDLVQPAVDLAEQGFELSWKLHKHALELSDTIYPQFIREFFTDGDGNMVDPFEIWKQPALANTLRFIRDEGRDGFYKGEIAEEIHWYMQGNGGLITTEDLLKYEAVERKPIVGTYKEFQLYTMPLPSSGGIAVMEMLNIMEHADFDSIPFGSAKYFHFIAEAMRRAFTDRAEFLGDPDFNDSIPVEMLLSKEFAAKRYHSIDWSCASISDSSRYGQIYEGDHTTHFSVIDKDGNAVSLTYTLERSYGSKMGSKKLGFIFNNEMGDFNPVPGYTNSNGLIGSAANIIEPEKRMLSSMSPTIITKDGKPYLIIGSPGGRTIINTVFQTILNTLEYKMTLKKSIESVKIHHQWLPDRILYEEDLISPDTKVILEEMGHKMVERENLGRLMGIKIGAKSGIRIGVSDSSSPDGGAVGY